MNKLDQQLVYYIIKIEGSVTMDRSPISNTHIGEQIAYEN